MFTGRWRLVASVTTTVMLAASAAACGQAAGPGGGTSNPASPPSSAATSGNPGTPAPPAATSPSPNHSSSAPPRASAADQLAGFFAAAAVADSRLKHTAALVNEGIGKTSMSFSPAALAAVKSLDTMAVAHAIPGGLPTELLRRTLLTYSDLVSRALSFRRVLESQYYPPFPIGSRQAKDVLMCLGNGSRAAARYGADLAAVRALAGETAPVTPPAPNSRAAAELALRVYAIEHRNSGCEECGGFIFTTLSHVVWQPKDEPEVGHSDGTIDGIRFRVTYHAGRGWDVTVWAC